VAVEQSRTTALNIRHFRRYLLPTTTEFTMKTIISSLFAACLMLAGSTAFADDMMKKDAMSHDSMAKDGMKKDAMAKDGMKKDAMAKDSMAKDGMKKDAMKKDAMGKDEMKK